MNNSFVTDAAFQIFEGLKPLARNALLAITEYRFAQAQEAVNDMRRSLASARAKAGAASEPLLNDLYVLDRYCDFLSSYHELWHKILNLKFSESWDSLQNALSLLRLIKRFSDVDIRFFEAQLIELERTYPYTIFLSIAVTAERLECSICGLDIDSEQCPHMRGHLYNGVMASAIIRDITHMDHVAMVPHPEDKRCVIKYDDTAEQFKLIRYLSTLIATKKFQILDFGYLRFSKENRPNPDFRKLGRNDPCFCGSGKKFKKCCIASEYVEGDHVDLIAEPRRIEDAVI